MKRFRRLTYLDKLRLLFLAGSISGCIIANLLGGELLEQIGSFDFIMEYQQPGAAMKKQLWMQVTKKRMMQLGLGGLVGMTPLAPWAFAAAAAVAGGASAVLISTCTIYGGWMGLGIFLGAVMPQYICYIPVAVILAAAAEHGTQSMKGKVWVLLAVLTAAGAALEVYFPL